MQIQAIKTDIFQKNQDLFSFLVKYFTGKIKEGDVAVITSKIVSLAEGRVIDDFNEAIKEELIKKESDLAIKTKYTWLTIKDNTVMASAGIDESNADGRLILLPRDSYQTAQEIMIFLKKYFKLHNLGVLITDSRLLPLRAGVVGVALGYSGFNGVRDYVGTNDIFGRELKFSRTDVADSLATAAVLEMGEGNEQQPLAIISKIKLDFRSSLNRHELDIDIKEDVYQPIFENIKKINWKK